MTREARLLSGIILITVPSIQYGGYFLLTSLMDKTSGYMDKPAAPELFSCRSRARWSYCHSLAGVSGPGGCGVASRFAVVDRTDRRSTSRNSHPRRIFLVDVVTRRHPTQRRSWTNLCRRHSACRRSSPARRGSGSVSDFRLGRRPHPSCSTSFEPLDS